MRRAQGAESHARIFVNHPFLTPEGQIMKTRSMSRAILVGLMAVSLMPFASAQEKQTTDVGTLDRESAAHAFPKPSYSPYAGRNFPTRPYFGDTHLHTSYSMDAGAFGCRLGPKDAYRFAKGEEITSSSGQIVRLSRPLDFLVVA